MARAEDAGMSVEERHQQKGGGDENDTSGLSFGTTSRGGHPLKGFNLYVILPKSPKMKPAYIHLVQSRQHLGCLTANRPFPERAGSCRVCICSEHPKWWLLPLKLEGQRSQSLKTASVLGCPWKLVTS